MSPNFERLRKAFLLQGEPDRVPLFELEVHKDLKLAFMGGKMKGLQSEVEFWVKTGYDSLPIQTFLEAPLVRRDRTEEAAALHQRMHRPGLGKYSFFREEGSQRFWMEEGKGVITSQEEFESFPWALLEDRSSDHSILEAITPHLPQGMKVVALPGPLVCAVYRLMGQETFYLSLYENPDLVARMFEKVAAITEKVVQGVLEHDCVGAIGFNDDIAYSSDLLISPQHLRQYAFPWYKRFFGLAKEKDRPVVFHSDGRLDKIIVDLIDCGINALHPIEPKAMDILQLKRTYGDRICLIGNIDLAYTLTRGRPEEVEEEVKQRLRHIAPGGGYCVSSSNTVTEYVPMENFNAMRETVLRYGSYPISI